MTNVSVLTAADGFERVKRFASIAFCGVLPVLALMGLYATVYADESLAFDFRPFYRAAGSILDGDTPYPAADDPLSALSGPYVYPPLGALLSIPFRVASFDVAGMAIVVLLTMAVAAILFLLGVRDWRCYGVVFLWPPTLNAIQSGNMTLFLGVAAAVAWRFRDRPPASAAAVALSLAAKFFLWPLLVWLAATRRRGTALLAAASCVALLLVSWAAIGFAGLREYPELLRRLDAAVGADSYTLYIVGLDAGLSSAMARALWLSCGLVILGWLVLAGRRGDERTAFVLAVVAALALTPIVWLHYFALLMIVVALAAPRLSVAWLVPLAMVVTPGSGQPSPSETLATLVIAALTIALALRALLRDSDRAADTPSMLGRPQVGPS